MKKALLLSLLCFAYHIASSQDTFYDMDSVQDISIHFPYSNWDYQLDTAIAGSEGYIIADSVSVNGQLFLDVGVKYKGNSSYSVNRTKNPLHIKLDYTYDQEYQGYDDIKLGNGFSDASMIREVSSYDVLRKYMDGPRCNYARVTINGSFWGIYTNSEDLGNSFVEEHYYSSCGAFFKCNPQNAGPGSTGSSLLWISADSSDYYTSYERQSDYGWKELLDFIDTLNNHASDISSSLDVDRALWMLAFNDVLVNLDSYSGAFKQNYYLYRDHLDRWLPTVWDLNMSYGGFTLTGTAQLTLTSMQTLTPDLHLNDSGWPLIRNLLANPLYKRMYYAHMRTINSENFLNGDYKTLIAQLRSTIDTIVQRDPNFLFTYTQYQNALTTATGTGMGSAPIYPLMDTRAQFLSSAAQLLPSAPIISLPVATPSVPAYGSTINVTVEVINASSSTVWLGYRYKKSDQFERIPMFDDGQHGDGAAGDNVFGTYLPVNSLRVQYYIYAENGSAGAFSPERAEHEFYSLNAFVTMASPGDIVLNEVQAANTSTITNEECKHRDWIELHNLTTQTLGLDHLYMSDDPADLLKWSFPRTAYIEPNGYLLVWADDINELYLDYHTNFNLSAAGERLFLCDSLGNILDSASFTSQFSNHSLSRCQDGTGPFLDNGTPTPRVVNDCSGVYVQEVESDVISVFPNPATRLLQVSSEKGMQQLEVFDFMGRRVFVADTHGESHFVLDVQEFPAGAYLLKIDNTNPVRIIRN
ncbi:MAG: CotH kinase family protein [Bacteroidota bacterium]